MAAEELPLQLQLRLLAGRVEHDAELTRALGARLLSAAAGTRWESVAAQAMRERLAGRRAEADRAAAELDEAAAALRAHAAAVEQAGDALRSGLREVGEVVTGLLRSGR